MVHRIQNRNPGYSDFTNIGSAPSFNFSNSVNTPMSHGANALKLENEVVAEDNNMNSESNSVNQINNDYHKELLKDQQTDSIIEDTMLNENEESFSEEMIKESEEPSNGLENFGVDLKEDTPDLFSSDSQSSSDDHSQLSSSNEDIEEDDLEIPAFLRRQKN